MAFIPNATSFFQMFRRRSGTRAFFRNWHPDVLGTVVLGREFDDVSRPLWGARGGATQLPPNQFGTLTALNVVDLEIQRMTAVLDDLTTVTRGLSWSYLGVTTLWSPWDIAMSPAFPSQFRPKISADGTSQLPGSTRWFAGVSSTVPNGSLIGNQFRPIVHRATSAPGSQSIAFNPPLVIPAFFGLTLTPFPNFLPAFADYIFSVEYRELAPSA